MQQIASCRITVNGGDGRRSRSILCSKGAVQQRCTAPAAFHTIQFPRPPATISGLIHKCEGLTSGSDGGSSIGGGGGGGGGTSFDRELRPVPKENGEAKGQGGPNTHAFFVDRPQGTLPARHAQEPTQQPVSKRSR